MKKLLFLILFANISAFGSFNSSWSVPNIHFRGQVNGDLSNILAAVCLECCFNCLFDCTCQITCIACHYCKQNPCCCAASIIAGGLCCALCAACEQAGPNPLRKKPDVPKVQRDSENQLTKES